MYQRQNNGTKEVLFVMIKLDILFIHYFPQNRV